MSFFSFYSSSSSYILRLEYPISNRHAQCWDSFGIHVWWGGGGVSFTHLIFFPPPPPPPRKYDLKGHFHQSCMLKLEYPGSQDPKILLVWFQIDSFFLTLYIYLSVKTRPQTIMDYKCEYNTFISQWVPEIDQKPKTLFHCSECDKFFLQTGDLKRHRNVHTGKKPFPCFRCDKTFSQPGHLKTHHKSHKGEKLFDCIKCGKKFYNSTLLKRHQKSHTGEKPFSCSQCGKSFPFTGDLKNHKMVHTREKPFSCSLCNTSFSLPNALKRHQKIHTGYQPFSCSHCDQTFSQSGNMKRHQQTHREKLKETVIAPLMKCKNEKDTLETIKNYNLDATTNKPFSCSRCDKTYSQSGSMNRHKKTHKEASKEAYITPLITCKIDNNTIFTVKKE